MADFAAASRDLIKPPIEEAEVDPIHADQEPTAGIIETTTFEWLI
jgi:hypothetical protein